jgi:hypothetical protein
MINDQPPIPPLRQLCDERCAGGLAVTACYTTKWDVIAAVSWDRKADSQLQEMFPAHNRSFKANFSTPTGRKHQL